MMKPRDMALELLEYKINDFQGQRQVQGGVSSLWELYDYLCTELTILTPEQRKRVDEIGRTLGWMNETNVQAKPLAKTFEALVFESFADLEINDEPVLSATSTSETEAMLVKETLSSEQRQEQLALQKLAQQVFQYDLEVFLQQLAVHYRVERDRLTARLLYCLMQNLGRYASTSDFANDSQLTRFKVVQPMVAQQDPLASFNGVETILALLQEVVDIISSLGHQGNYKDLKLPRHQAFTYLKRMALATARDPYAGSFSLLAVKGFNPHDIRAAITQLDKEGLREQERALKRQELEDRLRLATANERKNREFFIKEVQFFTTLMEDFFSKLEPYLSSRVGGRSSDPQLMGGVLFAENAALNLNSVSKEAKSVTVKLKGPVRFSLSGVDIAVMGSKEAQSLFIAGREIPLEEKQILDLGRYKINTFYTSGYLHLRLQEERRSLAALASEALAILEVVHSPHCDALLKVIKAASNVVIGEPQEIVAQSIWRFAEMSAQVPNRKQMLDRLLKGAARAEELSIPDEVLSNLAQRFYAAMMPSQDLKQVLDSTHKNQAVMHKLSDDPITVTIAGQSLTLRFYKSKATETMTSVESVVVLQPGRVLGTFSSYLILPFLKGTLLCLRSGMDVALVYCDKVATPARV
jgi:hypothetical protein